MHFKSNKQNESDLRIKLLLTSPPCLSLLFFFFKSDNTRFQSEQNNSNSTISTSNLSIRKFVYPVIRKPAISEVSMDSIPVSIGEQEYSIGDIHEIFGYFLEEKMYTDVSLSVKCGDEWINFSAHKLILSMWSPVLADMCYKPCKESDDTILIEDVSPSTFDALLKFMYGSFSDRQLKDLSFLLKLYKAAVAYEIDALKDLCREQFICTTPNKNNVFQLLDAGKLLDCESLVQRCYKILQMKTAEVLAAQELCNITPAMLMTILDIPRVSFTSEYELISWVLDWVKNELLKESYKKTFKEILADYLSYLNFLNLTAEEFAKLCQSRKSDLMSEQEGFSIFMNIAIPGSHPLPSWCPSTPKHREYRNQNSDSLKSMDSVRQILSTHSFSGSSFSSNSS